MANFLEQELSKLNAGSVDWAKVKVILSGIIIGLNDVLILLPAGLAKDILAGLISGVNFVISLIPSA